MNLTYQQVVGRPFLWGVRDCYDVVRVIYRDNFQIELTDYARPTDWSSDVDDLIRKLYEREGFEMLTDWKVKDLRPADVLCMAIGESSPNHLAVFVGDNTLVHHIYGRLSSEEMFRDFYRNATCFLLRHRDVPDLRPVHPNVDIGSLLRERYRVQAD